MIEFMRVTKSYLGMVPVFSEAQFRIKRGEFFYLTGVSGAGKSTIFKLLMLMERPDSGSIRFAGQDLAGQPLRLRARHRRRIGMVFQDYRLLATESIETNVALPLTVAGVGGGELKRRCANRLEQVGLASRRKEPVMGLSGGEKQLVSIARALVLNPDVLLADEPTGNLDQNAAFRVMEIIREVHRQGCTVMVASHDLNLIRSFRARTLLIKDQRVYEVRLVDHPSGGFAGEQ